jgi:RHS repeat-associated protein
VQTWTVYDGQNTYADFDGTGTLTTRYLYGPAIDELFARTDAGGTSAWYLTDHLGSVRDIANVSGTVIDHLAYDSFGTTLSESSPTNGDRYKYTSREQDTGTGLQFNRGRYLNTPTGRWMSEDPLGFDAHDVNLMRYVANTPTAFNDPDGLWAQRQSDGGFPPLVT